MLNVIKLYQYTMSRMCSNTFKTVIDNLVFWIFMKLLKSIAPLSLLILNKVQFIYKSVCYVVENTKCINALVMYFFYTQFARLFFYFSLFSVYSISKEIRTMRSKMDGGHKKNIFVMPFHLNFLHYFYILHFFNLSCLLFSYFHSLTLVWLRAVVTIYFILRPSEKKFYFKN